MGRLMPELVTGVKGIEIHGKKLRITFTYKNVRCREVLDIPVTKANIKFATNKLAAIKHEIAIGTFSYASHFPDSAAITRFGKGRRNITLSEAFTEYWQVKALTLKPSTQRRYPAAIQHCINVVGPNRVVSTLLPHDMDMLRNELFLTHKPSTANHYIATFKLLIKWCEKNQLLNSDLSVSAEIKKLPLGKQSNADPFDYDEYQRLLAGCTHEQQRNMITVDVYTGLRTGELRALAWEDLDLEKGQASITRNVDDAVTHFKLPKTSEKRMVDLQPPVIEALRSQKKYTFMLPPITIKVDIDGAWMEESIRPVFRPSVTTVSGKHKDVYTGSGIAAMWSNIVRRSGVRFRRFYQMRHTFASWNLTSHGNLAYIAAQMGHKDYDMLQEVYGKWMESASKSESEKIWEKMQSCGHFAPMAPQENQDAS